MVKELLRRRPCALDAAPCHVEAMGSLPSLRSRSAERKPTLREPHHRMCGRTLPILCMRKAREWQNVENVRFRMAESKTRQAARPPALDGAVYYQFHVDGEVSQDRASIPQSRCRCAGRPAGVCNADCASNVAGAGSVRRRWVPHSSLRYRRYRALTRRAASRVAWKLSCRASRRCFICIPGGALASRLRDRVSLRSP